MKLYLHSVRLNVVGDKLGHQVRELVGDAVDLGVGQVHRKHQVQVLEEVLRDPVQPLVCLVVSCILLLNYFDFLPLQKHWVKAMRHKGGQHLSRLYEMKRMDC